MGTTSDRNGLTPGDPPARLPEVGNERCETAGHCRPRPSNSPGVLPQRLSFHAIWLFVCS